MYDKSFKNPLFCGNLRKYCVKRFLAGFLLFLIIDFPSEKSTPKGKDKGTSDCVKSIIRTGSHQKFRGHLVNPETKT